MRSQSWTRFLFISLFFALSLVVLPSSVQSFELLLGTESPGTFSYFSGRVLCRLINQRAADFSCRQIAIADGVDNLTSLHDGAIDISRL